MSYTVHWNNKIFTVPLADLTLISGNNYSLDATDFWIEVRRLEASITDGLYAEQALEYIDTQVLSGIVYSPIVKFINGYTWNISSSNINVSLIGPNTNLLDVFIPGNGISVLANNSGGKQQVGSGVTAQDILDIGTQSAADVFATIIENGESFLEQVRLMRAEAAGKIVKVGNIHNIRDAADSKNRITADADASGRDVTSVDGT